MFLYIVFFFFKQNTAYEMRISDWSSDVCSSDLPYGSTYPGLTPNLQALAGDTMVVDNYYNHTAATYRGLQGQMTSGFPRYGGSEGGKGWMDGNNADGYATRSYSSLSGVLDKAGYHPVFFAPPPSVTGLTDLIAMHNRTTAVRERG